MLNIQVNAISVTELLAIWTVVYGQDLELTYVEFDKLHTPNPEFGELVIQSGLPKRLSYFDAMNVLSYDMKLRQVPHVLVRD